MAVSDDRLGSLEDSVADLRDKNVNLASDIRGLTAALDAVHRLQVQHRKMERDHQAAQTRLTRMESEARIRARRSAHVIRLTAGALLLAISLSAALLYASLLHRVDVLLGEQRAGQINSCTTRNDGTVIQVRREQQLAAAEPNPTLKQVHSLSASALAKTFVNCDQFKSRR